MVSKIAHEATHINKVAVMRQKTALSITFVLLALPFLFLRMLPNVKIKESFKTTIFIQSVLQ